MHIYNWFSDQKEKRVRKVQISIKEKSNKPHPLPVHVSKTNKMKLSKAITDSLGGVDNIESYCLIPNSRRIRLTLVNPKLIDKESLEQLDTQLFMRIGKKIIHIIP